MTETRAEQEGDRRVAATVAAIVLLVLVVATIVAAAAMAYRDDGKGGGGGMPAFSGTLTDQQIRDVAAFVTTRVAK